MITLVFVVSFVLILLLLGFIMLLITLYEKKQHNFAIKLENVRSSFEKEMLKAQLEIQEQTFQYISQEIHDNVGQLISLAKLNLNTFNFSDTELSRKKINDTTELMSRALDDLRDLSKSLSSDIIRNGGLPNAIELQIGQLKKLEKYKVIYEINGDYQFLDEQKEMFILRILQEAINNILRHSEADTINILLSYLDSTFSLLIRDNGKGFDTMNVPQKSSSGINNMFKRAKMIGASISIESNFQRGTLIIITFPF